MYTFPEGRPMLIETAIGDAYGAGFEYVSERIVREHKDLSGYVAHPKHDVAPGRYTDDTQMSIAVAEAILSGERWQAATLAARFVGAFKRDQRSGYAQGFYAFLSSVADGDEFLARIRPDSDKSGAAMRAGPVGLFPTVGEVVDRCTVQARLTHDTPDGINAAVAAALLVHYFAYDLGAKAGVGAFLEAAVPGQWASAWAGKVKEKGWMSVRAAVTAVVRNARMSDLLRDCVAFGGDVDTVATIALGAASLCTEVEQDLPAALYGGLEEGTYGKAYLRKLDVDLAARFGLPHVASAFRHPSG